MSDKGMQLYTRRVLDAGYVLALLQPDVLCKETAPKDNDQVPTGENHASSQTLTVIASLKRGTPSAPRAVDSSSNKALDGGHCFLDWVIKRGGRGGEGEGR